MATRPRGVCPECGAIRQVRKAGLMGNHRQVIRRWYRGQRCAGSHQAPLRIVQKAS